MEKQKIKTAGIQLEIRDVSMKSIKLGDTFYCVPYEVARYIKELETDVVYLDKYRQMSRDEMSSFVSDRARAIADTLNGNYLKYNTAGIVYLKEKIDATNFDAMNKLCKLIESVVYDTANKPLGSDPHADGLVEEV